MFVGTLKLQNLFHSRYVHFVATVARYLRPVTFRNARLARETNCMHFSVWAGWLIDLVHRSSLSSGIASRLRTSPHSEYTKCPLNNETAFVMKK